MEFLSAWSVLSGAAGNYVGQLRDAAGESVQVRGADGVHITVAGAIILAQAAVRAMDADWSIST